MIRPSAHSISVPPYPLRRRPAACPAAMVIEYRRISGRQGIRRVDGDAIKDTLAAIGEIGRCTIGRKADRVRYGHAGIKPAQFPTMKAIDRTGALFCPAAHGPDPKRAAGVGPSIV